MNKKVVSFTGPRPKGLYGYKSKDFYEPLFIEIQEMLGELYKEGYRTFVTGGAQGFDMLVFQAVQNLKRTHSDIYNIIYIPGKGQENMWPENGLFGKKEYRQMLKDADDVFSVLEGRPLMNQDYLNRNKRMVEMADLVIGMTPVPDTSKCWGIEDLRTVRSGTAACLRYAFFEKKKDVKVLQVTKINGGEWFSWINLTENNLKK